LDVKPKTAGQFYRDEAAWLVSAAASARQAQANAPAPRPQLAPKAQPTYAEPVLDEPDRPPLRPEPPTNQNRHAAPRPAEAPRRRRSVGMPRLLARIVIAPLYAVVAVGAIGVIALFARGFFGT
jgi:hypothetical protein